MRDKEKQRVAQRQWYKRNRQKMVDKQREQRRELREWFRAEILMGLKCVKCSEDHTGCLDFHHRDPEEKDDAIALMLRDKASKERLLEEVAKCDVLCANCHRKHHWNERNGL